jgi:hypothetical protein
MIHTLIHFTVIIIITRIRQTLNTPALPHTGKHQGHQLIRQILVGERAAVIVARGQHVRQEVRHIFPLVPLVLLAPGRDDAIDAAAHNFTTVAVFPVQGVWDGVVAVHGVDAEQAPGVLGEQKLKRDHFLGRARGSVGNAAKVIAKGGDADHVHGDEAVQGEDVDFLRNQGRLFGLRSETDLNFNNMSVCVGHWQ